MKHTLISLLLCTALSSAFAGRPLAVDDANVNEVGAGHVEAWFEKNGSEKSLTIAPAYSPIKGLELALAYNRDQPYTSNIVALGAKYQITRPKEGGCHAASSLNVARSSGSNAAIVNVIGTCQLGFVDMHMNAGIGRNLSTKNNLKILGLAFEKDVDFATVHAEVQAVEDSKPLFQIGARKEVFKNWQLDGTLGRQGGQNVFSLGTKYQF
jgi:hypothetical protein